MVYSIRTNSARYLLGISPILYCSTCTTPQPVLHCFYSAHRIISFPWRQRAAYLACLFVSSLILSLQFTYVISFSELVSILSYQTSFWVMGPFISLTFLKHSLGLYRRSSSIYLELSDLVLGRRPTLDISTQRSTIS